VIFTAVYNPLASLILESPFLLFFRLPDRWIVLTVSLAVTQSFLPGIRLIFDDALHQIAPFLLRDENLNPRSSQPAAEISHLRMCSFSFVTCRHLKSLSEIRAEQAL
jgi:hypothetical protein